MSKRSTRRFIGARAQNEAAIDALVEGLRVRRYGQLELHLHDDRVVKLMCRERVRLFEEGSDEAHCTGTD